MEKLKTMQFGVHFMLDGYDANVETLKDERKLRKILEKVPEHMGMFPICEPVVVEVGPNNKKDPGGISGFVMIAESHVSFHTFPNRSFVTVDVYTCQNDLDVDKLATLFKELLELGDYDLSVVKRGIRYPSADIF